MNCPMFCAGPPWRDRSWTAIRDHAVSKSIGFQRHGCRTTAIADADANCVSLGLIDKVGCVLSREFMLQVERLCVRGTRCRARASGGSPCSRPRPPGTGSASLTANHRGRMRLEASGRTLSDMSAWHVSRLLPVCSVSWLSAPHLQADDHEVVTRFRDPGDRNRRHQRDEAESAAVPRRLRNTSSRWSRAAKDTRFPPWRWPWPRSSPP